MKQFTMLHPRATAKHLGLIPFWLREESPRKAAEQLDINYQHGGGWDPFPGFHFNVEEKSLQYPGDPKMFPFAVTILHGEEEVYMYPYAWVLIYNRKTGTHEVCRMD